MLMDSSGGGSGVQFSIYFIKGLTNIEHKEVTLSFEIRQFNFHT